MIVRPLLGLAALVLLAPAFAQQANPSATGEGSSSTAAARDALKQQAGDTDQTTLLKQTLTAVDKQYSMIRRGKVAATYDLSYSYIGQEKINADISSGQLTLFNIENDSSHTIVNTLSVDYGLQDNLTGSVSIPVISRYSQNDNFDGLSHSLGDIGLSARWQPIETQRGRPSFNLSGGMRLPTGRSPFKVDANRGLATGSGVTTLNGGVNFNHIVDPVALFGSINLGYSLPARHLSQIRNGRTLTRVDPGASLGFGFGFAYALSYNISTSFSLQETISAGSKLYFADGSTSRTRVQTAGVLNFGLGYRISPKTTINITAGIGLTDDVPNFTLGISMPLNF
ncbi:transporter [Noviherbaspirillum galbum]|uniref:Transporter n=1 Tax=Noviherbaspirillum galbum TaxID=2709383 RepID=A0A6B3SSV5_9BURK|nr:transporter [Noviherbaspirillum galbum]NEX64050.1 transporter [Noviherbaspirillum galbum]